MTTHRRLRGSVARAALLLSSAVLTVSCGREFPAQPTVAATIGASWPDTLLVGDTLELHVDVVDGGGRTVVGVPVTWESSDDAVLGVIVRPGPPVAGESGQRITVVARRTGAVDLFVVAEAPGLVERAELQRRIVIRERWISISAGANHSCAVSIQGDAYCWGGGLRLLGNGSSLGSFVPVRVLGGLTFASVVAGWEHSCGLTGDGLAYCWGHNPWGAVGNGTTDDQLAPTPISRGPRLTTLTAGVGFTCGVMSDEGRGLCWGDNNFGQVTTTDRDRCPVEQRLCLRSWAMISDSTLKPFRFTQISAGERHACGLFADGTAACWGNNDRAVLGDTIAAPAPVPRPVAGALKLTSISAGPFHTCGLTDFGTAMCWGTNQFGELGTLEPLDDCAGVPCARRPIVVPTRERFAHISVGGHTTCALTQAGAAFCWGLGDVGQLGTTAELDACGALACTRSPMAAGGELRFSSISVGTSHVCALSVTRGGYCWGGNAGGKLGIGSTVNSSIPMRIGDPPR